MSNLLQKIKTILLGPKTGMTLSSSAPKSDFKSRVRPVRESVEIDEPTPEPDGDGWIKMPNGDRVRKHRIGSMGSEMLEDDADETLRPGQRFRVIPSKFYRRNDRD